MYKYLFIIFFGCALLNSSPAQSRWDFIDPEFNNGSVQYLYPTYYSGRLMDMILLQDGSIIVGGRSQTNGSRNTDGYLMKVTADGLVDSTFGIDAKITIDLSEYDAVQALGAQREKYIATGQIGSGMETRQGYMLRFYADGTVDSTFGDNGYVIFDYGYFSYTGVVRDIFIAEDNSIYLTGSRTGSFLLLMHFLADGAVDTAFGQNGIMIYPNNITGQKILAPDSTTLLITGQENQFYKAAAMRVFRDGTLDTSYADNGYTILPFRNFQSSGDLFKSALQDDNALLIAGYQMTDTTQNDFTVLRLTPGGKIDSTFGVNGFAHADFAGQNDFAHDVLFTDNRIFVGGSCSDENYYTTFGVAAFTRDGRVDTTFAFGGLASSYGYSIYTLALDRDKIVAAGYAGQDNGYAVSRFRSIYSATGLAAGERRPESPRDFTLDQNYPNPFNPLTTIPYSLKRAGDVRLTVWDINGREVATIREKDQLPGEHRFTFDARHLASGIYFYQLRVNGRATPMRRMLLIK